VARETRDPADRAAGDEDVATERRARTDASPVSRRDFVRTAVAGAVLAGAGTAAGRSDPITVEASPVYRQSARTLVDGYERDEGDPVLRLRSGENPSDGAALRVAGRPADAAGAAASQGDRLTVAVTARGRGGLSLPEGEWRECLSPHAVGAHLADDVPVETWCESCWTAVETVEPARSPTLAPEASGAPPWSRTDATVLVHGTRSYQYSDGFGGVGHYRVESESLSITDAPGSTPPSGDAEPTADSHVPVVRLEYLSVAADELTDDVRSVVRYYDRRSPDPSTLVAHLPENVPTTLR